MTEEDNAEAQRARRFAETEKDEAKAEKGNTEGTEGTETEWRCVFQNLGAGTVCARMARWTWRCEAPFGEWSSLENINVDAPLAGQHPGKTQR